MQNGPKSPQKPAKSRKFKKRPTLIGNMHVSCLLIDAFGIVSDQDLIKTDVLSCLVLWNAG